MRWRRGRDPVRARIRAFGPPVSEVHRALDRRILWPLDPEPEWWTLVALRSAVAGAAVGVGDYEQSLERPGRYGVPAIAGLVTEDPSLELAVALHDRDAVEAACRLLMWAYAVEINVDLWGRRYRGEMELSAAVVRLRDPHETAVIDRGVTVLEEDAGERGLLRFRQRVLTEIVAATIGLEVEDEHPWLEAAVPAWLRSYARGSEAAGLELKRLAPYGIPRLSRA